MSDNKLEGKCFKIKKHSWTYISNLPFPQFAPLFLLSLSLSPLSSSPPFPSSLISYLLPTHLLPFHPSLPLVSLHYPHTPLSPQRWTKVANTPLWLLQQKWPKAIKKVALGYFWSNSHKMACAMLWLLPQKLPKVSFFLLLATFLAFGQ